MVKILICRIGIETEIVGFDSDCESMSEISIRSSGKICASHGIGRTNENVFLLEPVIAGKRVESVRVRVLFEKEKSFSSMKRWKALMEESEINEENPLRRFSSTNSMFRLVFFISFPIFPAVNFLSPWIFNSRFPNVRNSNTVDLAHLSLTSSVVW